jgi:UDP-glucose 4-epimerase
MTSDTEWPLQSDAGSTHFGATVWILGAKGFLGRHIARRFSTDGYRVIGLGRSEWDADQRRPWGVAVWSGAGIQPAALNALFDQFGRPDLVVHAAGSASIGRSLDDPFADFFDTAASTAQILAFLCRRAHDTPLVLSSSAAVYGAHGPDPIPETCPLLPVSPYGSHKRYAEELCLLAAHRYGLRCAIIRFFSLYGPELRKQILWDIGRKLIDDPPVIQLSGSGEETRDFVYIEDAVELISACRVAASCEPLVVNGGTGSATRVRDLASAVVRALGRGTKVQFSGVTRKGDPEHYCADTRRADALGFCCQWSLEHGLAAWADWFARDVALICR